jgi:formylglycine-generating enzyme required for sulfatase activity
MAGKLALLLEPKAGQVKQGGAPKPAKELVNSIGMKLTLIPAGEFQMGSTDCDDEEPRHLVKINRPFYLGVYPVTQHEYM